jgi:hypothetical protein
MGREHSDEIARLEARLDELVARIESCRKFILAGRIVVTGGGVTLVAVLIGGISFNPSILALAVAAMLGGIVAAGSNRSTAKEAEKDMISIEAKRLALISELDLRLVKTTNANGDSAQDMP